MRAIGVDLGRVRVGIAITDELGLMAHPRPYLDGRSRAALLEALAALAEEEQADVFVVGLPTHMDGRESPSSRRARSFADALAARSARRVEMLDERWTTLEARRRLRDQGLDERRARERVDSAAATLLLQAWLDAQRARES